jgi:PAS domain S-box-containing protein
LGDDGRKPAGVTDTKAESIYQAGVRSAERLFESIANYSYDWESWIDPGGKPRWINPAVARMTGYTVEECLHMADYPLPLIDRDDRSEIRRHLRAAARKTSGNDIAFRIKHRDGSLRWAAVSYQSLYDDEGRWLGYRTSVRDFTERKRSEEAIRAAHEEAARANRAKGQFLAAASHDLRQPLQAANLFLAALKSQGLDAQQQETAANIDMALQATNDLLDSLLDMSRLDAGVLQPQFRDFRLQPVVDKLVGEFVEEAAQRKLSLRVAAIPHAVRSDPQLIERLLRNLVANALRYTEKGGVLIGARRRGGRVLLGVWDTGIGIAPDDTRRIFEEFVQLGNIERDRRRGLGLGLAIVDRIGRLLDHPVTLRSRLGRGSVFEIALPVADEWDMPNPVATVVSHAGSLTGRHVLAIEDEPMQREALAQLFRKWGCRIETVRSAVEGLQLLADTGFRPEIIIADYRLRDGRNGADAIRVLRQFCGRAVPGVIVTGDTEPKRLAEAKASGFMLLHKPVDPDRLRTIVENLLD